MRPAFRWLALSWLALLCLGGWPATATGGESLRGKVIEVLSGDSLLLEDAEGRKRHLRLFAIAAPESRQAHAAESRRGLVELLQGKRVTVELLGEDRLGRLIGKVLVAPPHCATCPPSRDAALAQVEAGAAWWNREERRQQTLYDQGYYEYAEFDAKTRRRGLWRDESPVPPWEWRKRQGRPVMGGTHPGNPERA
jgi:endonuclease YncB( thermonuclease family)